MTTRMTPCLRTLRPILAGVATILLALPAAASAQPLVTAFTSSGPFAGNAQDSTLAFARARFAGAGAVRIYLSWRGTAPGDPPSSWDPTNPDDSRYTWYTDDQVRRAVAAGLKPIISVSDAPGWAERSSGGPAGTNSPDAGEYAKFMLAAARRYSGATAGVPVVRYWQVWNEPNASFFFGPQRADGRDVSPGLYRALVNGTAASVRSVSSSNRVIAGGTFPFRIDTTDTQAIGGLRFLKEVLAARTDFDIWSAHPYTQGNAFHSATNADGASLGDLPQVKAALDAGAASGKIGSRGTVRFWVTEFQWDSSPPDPKGVPEKLLRRWTAEALYQAWRSGVSLFTWFQLRDDPLSQKFQGGLYLRCPQGPACDQPKPNLAAFRFPFVAYREKSKRSKASGRKVLGKVKVWGRTPAGIRAKAVVEQKSGKRWVRLLKLTTDGNGIFSRRIATKRTGPLRVRRKGNNASAAFSLKVPADRFVEDPFGS